MKTNFGMLAMAALALVAAGSANASEDKPNQDAGASPDVLGTPPPGTAMATSSSKPNKPKKPAPSQAAASDDSAYGNVGHLLTPDQRRQFLARFLAGQVGTDLLAANLESAGDTGDTGGAGDGLGELRRDERPKFQPSVLDRIWYAEIGEGNVPPRIWWGPLVVSSSYGGELRDPAERAKQFGLNPRDFEDVAEYLRDYFNDATITADEVWRLGALSAELLRDVKDRDWTALRVTFPHARAMRYQTTVAQKHHLLDLQERAAKEQHDAWVGQQVLMYMQAIVIGPSTQILSSAVSLI